MTTVAIATRDTKRDVAELLGVGFFVILAVAAVFHELRLDLMQSDVADYAAQSRRFWVPDSHVAGYAILVATARALTFELIPDVALMQLLSMAAWGGSLVLLARALRDLPADIRRWGLAFYGLFPFVTLSYVAFPISDAVVHLALAWGFLALRERSWRRFTWALATMLIVHKGLWPFAATFAIVAVGRGAAPWRIAIAAVPLVALWLGIAANGGGLLWIVRVDLTKNLPSHSGLPIFDGVLGTLAAGGARGLVKGTLLLSLVVGSAWLVVRGIRTRCGETLAVALPLLGFLVVLNQIDAWASLRLARIVAAPVAIALGAQPSARRLTASQGAFWAFVGTLAATQLAFAVYMDRFFANDPSR